MLSVRMGTWETPHQQRRSYRWCPCRGFPWSRCARSRVPRNCEVRVERAPLEGMAGSFFRGVFTGSRSAGFPKWRSGSGFAGEYRPGAPSCYCFVLTRKAVKQTPCWWKKATCREKVWITGSHWVAEALHMQLWEFIVRLDWLVFSDQCFYKFVPFIFISF